MGSLFSKPKTVDEIKGMTFDELMNLIQPLWNKYNMGHGESQMSKVEMIDLKTALEEYKSRGFDVSYFTSGAGAPGNCVVC